MEIKDLQKENEISLGALGMGVQQVGGGITEETDPTVPQWAKEPNKPTYTYDEITEKPTLVEEIGSSIEEDTNELTIELKDKDGNVLATSKVKLPSTQIDVDTELSDTSTNPVENQAVTKALSEKVGFTNIAGDLKPGLVAGSKNYYGFIVTPNTGLPRTISLDLDSYTNIRKSTNQYWFMSNGTLENIKNDYVKRGITENDITLTAEEKANALAWLGASSTKLYQHTLTDGTNIMTIITDNEKAITAELSQGALYIQGHVISACKGEYGSQFLLISSRIGKIYDYVLISTSVASTVDIINLHMNLANMQPDTVTEL